METFFSEEQARENLEKGYGRAEAVLADPEKVENVLDRLENELNRMEVSDQQLEVMDVFASLMRNYMDEEYTEIPHSSIIAVMSALIYLVDPMDAIPDSVPVVGKLDDVGVVLYCYDLLKHDMEKYINWMKAQ